MFVIREVLREPLSSAIIEGFSKYRLTYPRFYVDKPTLSIVKGIHSVYFQPQDKLLHSHSFITGASIFTSKLFILKELKNAVVMTKTETKLIVEVQRDQ